MTHYTEHTDKDVQEKEDEILIIKIPKKAVKDMNHIIHDEALKGKIEKYIWVQKEFDVLLTRKNCETKKDEAGEDCQLPDSLHHNSELYKRYDNNNRCSFQ